jgi:hypothetical protein
MIKAYNRPNNALVGLDIPLIPGDMVTVIWGKESLKEMEDVLYVVQNTNSFFLLTHESTERLISDYLFVNKKRYSSFKNYGKTITDLHALFTARVVITRDPKILPALGFTAHRGDGYYYSISNNTRYNF